MIPHSPEPKSPQVFKAKGEDVLKNEIFIQLMKQLTNNPTPRSELLGWKLMCFLCQYVVPSKELVEYLRAFVMKMKLKARGDTDYAEILAIATQCYEHLEQIETKEPIEATAEEVEKTKREKQMGIVVSLMDDTTRKVYIDTDCSLSQLTEKLSTVLNISTNPHEFSFFQLTEGLESHRLLPDHANVLQLFDKWQKLYEATRRQSKLLWKRRYLKPD